MTLSEYRASVSEADVQRSIIDGLEWLGYLVLVTSRVRKRCRHCGQVSAGGDGATKGLPDLFVRHPDWRPYRWDGVEVKNAKGRPTPEQKQLAKDGHIVIVRSLEEARKAVEGG